MDERIKLLSYSSLLTLHACPRKFQLYRLKADKDDADPVADKNQNLTFAYGHAFGEGMQLALEGKNREAIYWHLFKNWYVDLEDRNDKQGKNFYGVLAAINKFCFMREAGYLDEYELVTYNGRPAVELSFRITFPDGFTMRGSVDGVLQHKETGEILVLETKTSSSANLNPAKYKNSAQAVGYSVVLDVLFPEISSYEVLYLEYSAKTSEFEQLRFNKSYLQRATWIQELLLDIETIKLYEGAGVYPMRGENCYDFFRECEYLNTCTLSTKYLMKPIPEDTVLDDKIYDVELSLMDLIQGQLDKNAVADSISSGTITMAITNSNPHGDMIL